MIVVDSRGGLANRMQAIDSALSLASALRRPLRVPWLLNGACGARADQLFVATKNLGEFSYFDTDEEVDGYLARLRATLEIDHFVLPFADIPNADMASSLGDIHRLRHHPVVLIRSWARFYPSAAPFRSFEPLPPLRNRVQEVAASFERTVGVHLRRADHADAISGSPTPAFRRIMDRMLDSCEASTFFLSTDDPIEEAALRRDYPTFVYSKRSLDRATLEGVQDAVIDLYCLAATRVVVGSAGSTFSIVAAEIAGASLVLALNETPAG